MLGANIGGIPELIRVGETGELFESGNRESMKEKNSRLVSQLPDNEKWHKNNGFVSIESYSDKFINKVYT